MQTLVFDPKMRLSRQAIADVKLTIANTPEWLSKLNKVWNTTPKAGTK